MIQKKLIELKQSSSKLDPDPKERIHLQNVAINYANRFYDSQQDQKAYREFDESVKKLLDEPVNEEPGGAEKIIRQIENVVVRPGLNTVSGRHFGYIPGGGLASSAVGDFLAAMTNRYAGVYASSPGAVVIETRLINWLCELIGYDEQPGGYLSSGGSHANLTALVTARDSAGLKAADYSKAVVYLTKQTHHCVDRALNIIGMRECHRRYIPMDDKFRMIPFELERSIDQDRKDGLIPWVVVASAGSTDTGAIDPLDEIGETAKKNDLWYHVDAAYGGFFILTEDGKKKLKGIEKSDSVVMDPHKGLFLPYGTGALIVKDVKKLAEAHRFEANYMKDANIKSGIYSPAEISPELSKHFRGLRMWMPLKLHGVKRFRDALDEKQLLARYLWEKMKSMDEIEVGPEPQLSIFMFRWNPGGDDLDALNRELHKLILKDGRFFLSTTEVDGVFFFRVAILSVRTHLNEVNELVDIIREKIREIKEKRGYSSPS
ncbi:MAG: aminotransferase class V-fold PLP-dependent enzyme [Balneolaceae bacterium]|nr:aminotransferase class V-fold PLP-dependent enzyme [Balneolaceae bacterium]